jgi:metalloendopeptidase OMA1, mitochondrial
MNYPNYRQQPGRAPQRRGFGLGWIRLLPLLLFGLYAAYYWFSNQETVPLTGRKQLVDLTREQEAALGYQSYQEILANENVLTTGDAPRQVREIAVRLIEAVRKLDPKADPGFDWEANVIQSDQANAFALPGGKIAVYTGIFPVAANENGLAAVMGHEIAHAIARHGAERMAYQKLVQMGSMAAGVSVGDMSPAARQAVMGALGAGAKFGVLLPFSRDHETEADQMGLMFAAAACYDPREAPKLWERMAANSSSQGGQRPPEFASTHPSNESRINNLNALMPKAMEIYNQYCANLPAERG